MPSGAKPISGYADGAPPTDVDDYVFERAGVTYRIPYSALRDAIVASVIVSGGSPAFLPLDGIDGEDAESIPGQRGVDGVIGVDGRNAPFMFPEDAEIPEEPLMIPGPRGATGAAGAVINTTTYVLPDSPDEPDEPFMIKGDRGATGPAGGGGSLTEANLSFADGDYYKVFTIADASVVAGSKIAGNVNYDIAEENHEGFIFHHQVVDTRTGAFDLLVTALDIDGDDMTGIAMSATPKFQYMVSA